MNSLKQLHVWAEHNQFGKRETDLLLLYCLPGIPELSDIPGIAVEGY